MFRLVTERKWNTVHSAV